MYNRAKKLFAEGMSLRQIEKEVGINRKTLSRRFKMDGLSITKGIDSDTYDMAKNLIKSGKKITNVCIDLGLDRHTLSKMMYDRGDRIPQNYSRLNEYDSKIIDLYGNGMSINNISKNIGVSTNVIWNALRNNNIDTNRVRTIYSVNENAFDTIDSEEKAYWLGFLYADGYVNTDSGVLSLALQVKDIKHLERFRSFMKTNIPIIRKYITTDDKIFESCRIDICRKRIATSVCKLGCTPTKSLTLRFPTTDQVPKHLIHHFMRGYFDGDGSIYHSKQRNGKYQMGFSIIGTLEFINEFDNILNCSKTKRGVCGKAYELRHSGNIKVMKIFNYLYNDATIYLERKYTKFVLPS